MKTIIYKKCAKRYECAEIRDGGGDEIEFIFDLPINARMTLSEAVVDISDGVGRVNLKRLPEGDIFPKLFLGGRIHMPEGFTVSGGAVMRKPVGEEYIRHLSHFCEELSGRVEELERKTEEIQNKITQKIKF